MDNLKLPLFIFEQNTENYRDVQRYKDQILRQTVGQNRALYKDLFVQEFFIHNLQNNGIKNIKEELQKHGKTNVDFENSENDLTDFFAAYGIKDFILNIVGDKKHLPTIDDVLDDWGENKPIIQICRRGRFNGKLFYQENGLTKISLDYNNSEIFATQINIYESGRVQIIPYMLADFA